MAEFTLEKLVIDRDVKIRFREETVSGGRERQTTESDDSPRKEMGRVLQKLKPVVLWLLGFPRLPETEDKTAVCGVDISERKGATCVSIIYIRGSIIGEQWKFKLPPVPIDAIKCQGVDVEAVLLECQDEAERYISGHRAQMELDFGSGEPAVGESPEEQEAEAALVQV